MGSSLEFEKNEHKIVEDKILRLTSPWSCCFFSCVYAFCVPTEASSCLHYVLKNSVPAGFPALFFLGKRAIFWA